MITKITKEQLVAAMRVIQQAVMEDSCAAQSVTISATYCAVDGKYEELHDEPLLVEDAAELLLKAD